MLTKVSVGGKLFTGYDIAKMLYFHKSFTFILSWFAFGSTHVISYSKKHYVKHQSLAFVGSMMLVMYTHASTCQRAKGNVRRNHTVSAFHACKCKQDDFSSPA
jgi:hypothetical protein